MFNVVVLGGSGMLGHQLVKALDDSGFNVKSTWYSFQPHLIQEFYSTNVRWIKFPSNKHEWSELLKESNTVFHLANNIWTQTQLRNNPQGPKSELKKNTQILNEVRNSNIKKLIWISSSTGYSHEFEPHEENFHKGRIDGIYASLAKVNRIFENQLFQIAHDKLMDVRVFRPTTIVGCPNRLPTENSHIFLQLIYELIVFKKTQIYIPDIRRNYIYSKDFANLLLEELRFHHEPGTFEAYNVRSSLNCNLSEIASVVMKLKDLKENSVSFIATTNAPRVIDLPSKKLENRHKMRQTPLEQTVTDIVKRVETILEGLRT